MEVYRHGVGLTLPFCEEGKGWRWNDLNGWENGLWKKCACFLHHLISQVTKKGPLLRHRRWKMNTIPFFPGTAKEKGNCFSTYYCCSYWERRFMWLPLCNTGTGGILQRMLIKCMKIVLKAYHTNFFCKPKTSYQVILERRTFLYFELRDVIPTQIARFSCFFS